MKEVRLGGEGRAEAGKGKNCSESRRRWVGAEAVGQGGGRGN